MQYLSLAVDGLAIGSVYALVAIGFHLIYRTSGVVDFAQGEKVVVGGLIGLALVRVGMPVILVLIVVPLLGFALGAAYERVVIRPTLRNGEIAVITATVGAMLVLAYGHILIWGANGVPFPAIADGSLRLGELSIDFQNLWIWGALTAVAGLLWFGTNRSRVGKGMIAAASDPLAATAIGVNTASARTVAFSLAFALAALGGVLIAPITLAGGTVGFLLVLKGFTGAVLGGLESLHGVIIGSLLLGAAENILGGLVPSGYKEPIILALLLAILLVLPSGLFGNRRVRLA